MIGSIIKTYETRLPISVQRPNSSGLRVLVTKITKIVPVITLRIETASAINPE